MAFESVERDDDTGEVFIHVAFCPKCDDTSVPYMNSHLSDDGRWTCQPGASDDARSRTPDEPDEGAVVSHDHDDCAECERRLRAEFERGRQDFARFLDRLADNVRNKL